MFSTDKNYLLSTETCMCSLRLRGGMGPLLVLDSPCFRENVVVTCKIGSFLCSWIIYFTKT